MSFGIGTRNAIDVGLGGIIAFATNPWGGSVFDGAAAAYSTRIPAGGTYGGPLLRVRRSSDNAEQDIYASAIPDANGNRFLDTTALLAFAGVNSAFVTTWYDQSGNGRHATQTTTAAQPRIVNAGVVETAGGIPATVFDGTQVMTAPVDFPSAFTVNWVGQTTADVGFQMFVSKTNGVANHPFDMWTLGNTNIFISESNITVFFLPGNGFAVSSGRSVWTFQGALGAGNVNGWRNNASIFAPVTATVYSSVSSLFYIGQRGGGGTTLIGNIQEITCFDVLTATNPRQTLERNQGTAFGITVA